MYSTRTGPIRPLTLRRRRRAAPSPPPPAPSPGGPSSPRAAGAYYWELDDVVLGNTACDPVPGGLVIGQVTDTNTKAALAGVVVSETGSTSATGTSAVSADPAFTGAFYWLFSPNTGAQPFT